jgi:hypothetical protein
VAGVALAAGGTAALATAPTAAFLYSRVGGWLLRRRLMRLPPREAARVLGPLTTTRGAAGDLARTLSRTLRLDTELRPANQPAGRGDEASAVE